MILPTALTAAMLAGAAAAVPAPAYAVTSAHGYVWANQPSTSSYYPNTGYEYNSTGGDIEVIRFAEGRYRVRFAGMNAPGGVAHVRAYGSTGNICTVASWSAGIDLGINIRCFDTTGALADTRFVAHFTNRAVPGGNFAYFWAHNATGAGPYAPYYKYAYDSTGVANTVERIGVGNYRIFINALSELYPGSHDDGHMQVTAYNMNAVHCTMRLTGDENPTPLGVRCYDTDGDPVDSRFTVSYSHGVSHLGTKGGRGNAYIRNHVGDPPYVAGWWNSSGGEPVVGHPATGVYWVWFPGLGGLPGHAIVNSQEIIGHRCTIVSWQSWTPDLVINVRCHDGVTQALADYDFSVSYKT